MSRSQGLRTPEVKSQRQTPAHIEVFHDTQQVRVFYGWIFYAEYRCPDGDTPLGRRLGVVTTRTYRTTCANHSSLCSFHFATLYQPHLARHHVRPKGSVWYEKDVARLDSLLRVLRNLHYTEVLQCDAKDIRIEVRRR